MTTGSAVERSLKRRHVRWATVMAVVTAMAGLVARGEYQSAVADCPLVAARFDSESSALVFHLCATLPNVGPAVALRYDIQVRIAPIRTGGSARHPEPKPAPLPDLTLDVEIAA